jgi:hypothetical protein
MRRHGVLALLPVLAACHSMQAVPVDFIPAAKPRVVYLADAYGVTQEVANPRLSGDTVLGLVGGNPVAVPLHQVQHMSAVRPNRARTVMLVGGLVAVSGLMTYAIIAKTRGDASQFCDYDQQPVNSPEPVECGYHSNP